MPAGVHNSNVKLLGFWADAESVQRVDEARGIDSRSDYLRDALVEYLCSQGFRVPQRLRRAADRVRVPVRYPGHQPSAAALNEPPAKDPSLQQSSNPPPKSRRSPGKTKPKK